MIHRIKTTTWEVRSHSFITVLSTDGQVTSRTDQIRESKSSKVYLKRLARHIGDVIKCIRKIDREKEKIEQSSKKDIP